MNPCLRNIFWLLEREYLEHRRLLALPIAVGLATIVLQVALALAGHVPGGGLHVLYHRSAMFESFSGNLGGAGMSRSLAVLGGFDLLLDTIALLFALSLAVALFSYGLGCLYDERRDRSLLFWKSLPVSDAECVAAKAIMGVAVVPFVYATAGLATLWAALAVDAWLLSSAAGAAPTSPAQLARFSALVLAVLPAYAFSLAPGLGWLMLCSAAARRHPAVIALAVPVLCALLNAFGLPNPVWHWVVAPLVPAGVGHALQALDAGRGLNGALAPVYRHLAGLEPWAGVLFGLACLAAASHCRRRYGSLA